MPKRVSVTADGPRLNSIAIKRPDLLAEWDWDKNDELGLSPYTATCGMNRTVFWICPSHQHSYSMNIDTRVKSPLGCPFCSGRRVLSGFNDLATTNPEIASEWVEAIGSDATPQTVSAGSHVIVRWKCSIHECEWDAAVCDRTKGKGCQQCKREKISISRSKVKPGNSLAEAYPDVAAQWDYDLNKKTPDQVSAHAKMTAHWICDQHATPYKWSATVYSRTGNKPSGCPKCGMNAIIAAAKKPEEGQSLGDLYPDAIKEWAFDLNGGLTPFDVKPSSQQRFVWRCSTCNDTWSTSAGNRTAGHSFKLGCRKCKDAQLNFKRLVPRSGGYLVDVRPDIAAEWDCEKNEELLGIPLNIVSAYSNINAWWTCPHGHSYQTTVNHRVSRGDGCSTCAITTHVSFPEKAVYFYVSHLIDDVVENARPPIDGLGNLELDIWIPSLNTAIEYDGHFWHQDTSRDLRKDEVCEKAGIRLIRIREHGCPTYKSPAIMIRRETVYDSWSLNKAIKQVLKTLGVDADITIDTDQDEADIRLLISKPADAV